MIQLAPSMTEYEQATHEVSTGEFVPHLYRIAFAEAEGNPSLVQATYVRLRVQELMAVSSPPPLPAKSRSSMAGPASVVRLVGVCLVSNGLAIGAAGHDFAGPFFTTLIAVTGIILGITAFKEARHLHAHLLHPVIRWPLIFIIGLFTGLPTYSVLDDLKREARLQRLTIPKALQ